MLATEPTKTSSEIGYKTKLLEARKLRGKSGVKAFDRARILCLVFDDGQFRQECGNLDDFRAAELLDEYVDDLAVGFLDLRAMVKAYPKRSQWADGKLGRMLREMLRRQDDAPTPNRPVRVAVAETRKQLERQLEEARREKARIAAVEKDVVSQLKARIAELENENAQLRQRIATLEGENRWTP